MEIIKVKISEIIPYPNNPRKNDIAVPAVVESIRQCGYCAPIIVDESMVVLAGHTRLKAIKRLGWGEVEVCVKAGLTEEQKTKYRLLDNKTSEFAEWDVDLLDQELFGLDFGDFDFGFEMPKEEGSVVEDEYDAPPPQQPRTRLGDIYLLGRHRVMCGDATDAEAVGRLLNGARVDLFLTDPPYGVDYEGKTKDKLKIQNDQDDSAGLYELCKKAFAVAADVMKPGASFYIWHAESKGLEFREACRDAGLLVRQCLIWNKNSMVLGRQDYQWKHEPCLYGWKDGASHLWANDRKQTTVLSFDRPARSEMHPTMKPITLFNYLIQNNTRGEDVVLDSFGGSGTTLMACEQNGRTSYTMELDPKYVDVIVDRWEKFTGRTAERV